jgi:hypothetical protein
MYHQGVIARRLPGSDKYILPTYETNYETGTTSESGYEEISPDKLFATQYGHLKPNVTLGESIANIPAEVLARNKITDPSKLVYVPTYEYNSETGQTLEDFKLVDSTTGNEIKSGGLGNVGGNQYGGLYKDSSGKLQYDVFDPSKDSFFGGLFKGVGNLLSSDAVKFLGPMIASGGLGGAAGIGQSLGIGSIGGGAVLGAGTAALSGGDVLKGAIMGGLGGAGDIKIGDTGFTVGDLTKTANVVKSVESGDLLGAVVGAANIAGAGNTQIGDTGLTINDLSKNINLAKAVVSEQPQAIFNAVVGIAREQAALNTKDADIVLGDYFDKAEEIGASGGDVAQDPNLAALLAEFSNPQDLSDNPSVQVAGTDNAGALEALRDATEAGRAGGAGSGTFFDSLGRLRIADEGESEEDARAAARSLGADGRRCG